jgi:hypothetical protein
MQNEEYIGQSAQTASFKLQAASLLTASAPAAKAAAHTFKCRMQSAE